MTDTERLNWVEANKCALGMHITGQWRVIQNAQGGAFSGAPVGPTRISVGDTLRVAIDNGMNAVPPPPPPVP
jgi:hypothetical protein